MLCWIITHCKKSRRNIRWQYVHATSCLFSCQVMQCTTAVYWTSTKVSYLGCNGKGYTCFSVFKVGFRKLIVVWTTWHTDTKTTAGANTAARILTRTKKCEHISPIIQSLHWLPISKRIDYKILVLTYKCLHNRAPANLQELVQPYEPVRSLRSSSKSLLQVPKTRLKTYGDRAFAKAAPILWNTLPLNIRECDSLDTFKTVIKTYLFSM